MSDSTDSIIAIDLTHEEELSADGFDLFVTVRGSSVFTGNTAFEKAAEVRSLVAALVAAGVTRSDVSLVGVQVDVESGLLSKSSSARYSLRVRSTDCEGLSRVLTAISSAKNAVVDLLEWRYPEGEEAQQAWLRIAVADARGRANAIAESLGLTITSVKRVTTPFAHDGVTPQSVGGAPGGGGYRASMSKAARPGGVDLGLEVAPTKRVETGVHVEFVVRPSA